MINSYPEKPILPYVKTKVEMGAVVSYLKELAQKINKEVVISSYIMFRNESANGTKGVCNNYAGVQADSGRWQAKYDSLIVGTCVKEENKTGKQRIFCCFKDFKGSIDFLIDRVEGRGLYVGGKTHLITNKIITTPTELAEAYYQEWVTGNKNYKPSEIEIKNYTSMYKQGKSLF